MYAVIGGHEAVVRVLLGYGARVGDVDRDRRSALHLAVLHRRESVLRCACSWTSARRARISMPTMWPGRRRCIWQWTAILRSQWVKG
ncbi:uncharacterized protein B0T15DRAFT_540790 [Chaetomium strumarium]|uniref:Ankyrin repeat protein n=1 Tax=Chaetomium strumarium TaxID=1170767 RepID=A0AAJ0GPC8_9PEZI|nr:hypothetical protein B0T15DRAFT_540790 [Chaetomium strumarium]